MENKENKSELIIYKAEDGKIKIDVRFQNETVWLTQQLMAELFQTTQQNISLHIQNVLEEGELADSATHKEFLSVQKEGSRNVKRNRDFYNLDMIISVGYRVKSIRGTQFRIWATNVLKNHLINGYTLNEKRLKEQVQKLHALQRAVKLIGSMKDKKQLEYKEAMGLLEVISDYNYALGLLDDYDYKKLKISHTSKEEKFKLTYAQAMKVIQALEKKFGGSDLFGKEKDQSFKSSIATIYQTFGSKELYPSVEEKAANLLYFVVKNHSFVDGNKRIAASIFLWFLEANGLLYKEDGGKRIADNALVALTLMIAESDPEEREIIVTLVVNLINKNN